MDRGRCWATVHRIAKRHNWSDWACMQWCSSVEHLFIGLLTICIFSLEKCLLKCLGHFFHRVVCFFVVVFPFLGKYIPCKQQQITHSGSTCFHPASVSAKPHPVGAVGSKAQRYLPCGAHSIGNRALMRGQRRQSRFYFRGQQRAVPGPFQPLCLACQLLTMCSKSLKEFLAIFKIGRQHQNVDLLLLGKNWKLWPLGLPCPLADITWLKCQPPPPPHAYSVGCWRLLSAGAVIPKTGQCRAQRPDLPVVDRDISEGLSPLQSSWRNCPRPPLLQRPNHTTLTPSISKERPLGNHLLANLHLKVCFLGTLTFQKDMCLPAPQSPGLAHQALEFSSFGYVLASPIVIIKGGANTSEAETTCSCYRHYSQHVMLTTTSWPCDHYILIESPI